MSRRLCLVLLALAACRDVAEGPGPGGAPPDSANDDFAYPAPRGDVVARVGSPTTLEIATWNIENFPGSSRTAAAAADLITSLDLDIVVVEEIADDAAWDELLERLREHTGVLSSHRYTATEYQKIGVIYREPLVTAGVPRLLFTGDTYAFPRPPLSLPLTIDDGIGPPLVIEVIGVHLKAGIQTEDGARRRVAVAQLDAHIRAQLAAGGEDEVVIAGDYNEAVTTPEGQANLAPLLGAPERYTLHTAAAASAGQISFIPFPRLIDHLTTTAGLAAETAGARVVIPRLDLTYGGYLRDVSDHVPVVLIAPL